MRVVPTCTAEGRICKSTVCSMYDKRDTTHSLLIPERQKNWYRRSQSQDGFLYPSSAMNFINRLAVCVLLYPDTVPQQQIQFVKPAGFLKPTMVPYTRHDSSAKPWFPLAGRILQPSVVLLGSHDSSTKPWFPLSDMILQPSHGSSWQT